LPELGIIGDLGVVLGAALVSGILAHVLRQPVILGYLVVGVIIGPFGLGLVRELEEVRALAEFGVALLMFALGVQFSLSGLRAVQKVALMGGTIQIGATILVGIGVGGLLGWGLPQAVYFGCLIALSSTVVVLKTLLDRGELDSLHGRILTGFLIVQDLSVVPMMVLLPLLGPQAEGNLAGVGIAILKASVFLGAMLLVGTRLIPRVMQWVVAMRSRELFLLSIVALVLATAFSTHLFGLSLAFGAFVAGLVISESTFGAQALAEVIPLRDVFAMLFFVSIGMLTDPRFVYQNLGMVALVVAVIVVGKWVISGLATGLAGYDGRTSFFVGLGLIQIGEFSFLLAKLGLDQGIITEELYSLTLAGAIITIMLTPLAIGEASRLYGLFRRVAPLRPLLEGRFTPQVFEKGERLVNHAVVCGYGDVSQHLVAVLEQRHFSYLIIDLDPNVIEGLRRRGVPCIYGDAANAYVLGLANLERAKVLVLTVPDPATVEVAYKNALQINPRLDVVARTRGGARLHLSGGHGFLEIVEPEFEAGLEIMRHTLHRFGLSSPEVQHLINSLRLDHTRARGTPEG
jgi:CPA2 family monovalent cation:H+ antiporter-2